VPHLNEKHAKARKVAIEARFDAIAPVKEALSVASEEGWRSSKDVPPPVKMTKALPQPCPCLLVTECLG
jgi:hypothetical protein